MSNYKPGWVNEMGDPAEIENKARTEQNETSGHDDAKKSQTRAQPILKPRKSTLEKVVSAVEDEISNVTQPSDAEQTRALFEKNVEIYRDRVKDLEGQLRDCRQTLAFYERGLADEKDLEG